LNSSRWNWHTCRQFWEVLKDTRCAWQCQGCSCRHLGCTAGTITSNQRHNCGCGWVVCKRKCKPEWGRARGGMKAAVSGPDMVSAGADALSDAVYQ
jgi:hypothetical protein